MRDVLHDWWPVAAVTLFTLLLVVQIPRKAIFPPAPVENAVTPFASFVMLDDDAYAAALQRVRMSWQLRSRAQLGGGESRTAAFEFDEPLPAPRALPAGTAFAEPYRAPRAASAAPVSGSTARCRANTKSAAVTSGAKSSGSFSPMPPRTVSETCHFAPCLRLKV